MAAEIVPTPSDSAKLSDARCRIDAARQLLGRVDELGERFVVEHTMVLLSAAWAAR